MNRTILFRGKREDNGKWVEGGLFVAVSIDEDGHRVEDCFIQTNPLMYGGTELTTNSYEVIPETVGQYTGLTDKNGKMIFEGDVAKAEHDNYYNPEHEEEPEYSAWIGSIEYEEGYYQINTNCEYRPAINNIRIKTIEVIGNIHDKPELLKESEK